MAYYLGVLATICVVLSAAGAAAQTTTKRGTGGEFSATIVFLNMADVNSCKASITTTRQFYTHNIQFMPTVYWTGGPSQVSGYCVKDENWQCSTDPALKQRWQAGLQACFQFALQTGFTGISVIQHADYAPTYVWRNTVDFNPTQVFGGQSYDSVGLSTTATALKAAIGTRTGIVVHFAMSGEMGQSNFMHPTSWQALYTKYKQFFNSPTAMVGLELNYQKVCSCVNTGHDDPFAYAAAYNGVAPAQIAQSGINKAAVVTMLNSLDFLSVSLYHPMPNTGPFKTTDFTLGLDWFAMELASFGFSLDNFNKVKPLHIGETGFGGGAADGSSVAPSLAAACRTPFFGTWYPATGNNNPWLQSSYQNARRAWYLGVFTWLESQQKTRFYVEMSFNFCAGSFDFMGVQPQSTGFYDQTTANQAKKHNKIIHGITVAKPAALHHHHIP